MVYAHVRKCEKSVVRLEVKSNYWAAGRRNK